LFYFKGFGPLEMFGFAVACLNLMVEYLDFLDICMFVTPTLLVEKKDCFLLFLNDI